MNKEWDDGWQAGFDYAYANCSFTVRFEEKNGEKFYSGSHSVKFNNWERKDFVHRGSYFDRGYAEGIRSGSSRKWDENRDSILKELGIKMPDKLKEFLEKQNK